MKTLAQNKKRPFTSKLDLRAVPLIKVVERYSPVRQFLIQQETELQKPEVDAIWFYMMNAAVARICQKVDNNEVLSDELLGVVNKYHEISQRKLLRMFYYILLICTRESRHGSDGGDISSVAKQKYPEQIVNFWKSIRGCHSMQAVEKLLATPPPVTFGEYTDFLVWVFEKPKYSHAYGGKKWANVADCLKKFVHGETSAEMMLDTAFTLCHNGGPIFNKGMLYKEYNGYELVKILDVQRAGMIPQLVLSGVSPFVTAEMQGTQQGIDALLGKSPDKVDWEMVEKLGAVQHYSKEKSGTKSYKKKSAHVVSSSSAGADSIQIMPGVYVEKVKRSELPK